MFDDRGGSTRRSHPVASRTRLDREDATFLVLWECFYGTTRFEDFINRVPTSAPALSRAQTVGVRADRHTDPLPLTPAGEDLLPAVMSLSLWGNDLHNGPPPMSFVDARTGRPVRVCVTTDSELPETRASNIEIRATFTLD